jgi:hypothetical protein
MNIRIYEVGIWGACLLLFIHVQAWFFKLVYLINITNQSYYCDGEVFDTMETYKKGITGTDLHIMTVHMD